MTTIPRSLILPFIKSLSTFFLISLLTSSCFAEKAKPSISTSSPSIEKKTWEATEHGVTFSLMQILPDQIDAFYLGRGFTLNQIKPYAKTCVYMGVLRNDSASGKIHFLRNSWSIVNKDKDKNKLQYPKANSEWIAKFKLLKVKPSALIAFRFAQLPEEQEYETGGDWNQGMLSVNLPVPTKDDKKSQFDITVRWDIKGKPYELTLQEVKCVKS